jgi:TolB-like protein/Tfp pilus assembly protein PilF
MSGHTKYVYAFGPFLLNPAEGLLLRNGKPVALTPKAFETLLVLVRSAGHVVGKDVLIKAVWPDTYVEEANLTQNVFTLRKALGSGDRGRPYIETIPRRGYRFVSTVRKLRAGSSRKQVAKKGGRSRVAQGRRKTAAKAVTSIAVLPLVNAGADPGAEYLSDGITESIINKLSRLPGLRVMARSTAFRYKGRETDPQEVGRQLGVGAVLMGRVLQLGQRLIIRTELIDATNGYHIWGEEYKREASDLLAVQEDIACDISDKLKLKLTGEQKKLLAKRHTENTEAYHAYLKGRYYWNRRTESGLLKGIEYFQRAIAVDSDYALAYTGLADCYSLLNSYGVLPPRVSIPKTKEAAEQALRIDEMLAEAHASLGLVNMVYEWDWAGAESEFKRAIKLDPNYATGHHWYALYLRAVGRFDQALVEIRRAQRLDPLSLIIGAAAASHFFYARQYDQAIAGCRETLDLDANFHVARGILGEAFVQKRMYQAAVEELQKVVGLSGGPEALALLGHAYALSGHRDEAMKVLDELGGLARRRYIDPSYVALIYTGLAQKDSAFEWLEKSYDDRVPLLSMLKVDPRLDILRSETRYLKLLRRVGLTP